MNGVLVEGGWRQALYTSLDKNCEVQLNVYISSSLNQNSTNLAVLLNLVMSILFVNLVSHLIVCLKMSRQPRIVVFNISVCFINISVCFFQTRLPKIGIIQGQSVLGLTCLNR